MKRIIAGLLLALSTFAWADVLPMTPVTAGTTTITVGTSTAATALPVTVASNIQVELQNAGSAVIFVEFGTSAATAAVATGYPILVGQSKVVTVPATATHIATISGTASQTLYVTIGRGN